MRVSTGKRAASIAAALILAVVCCVQAAPAYAAPAGAPHWMVTSNSAPTYFKAGDEGDFYEIAAVNDGSAEAASGAEVAVQLPEGVTATALIYEVTGETVPNRKLKCDTATVSCTVKAPVPVGGVIVVRVYVNVSAAAEASLSGNATVTGGGAEGATTTLSTKVSAEAVPYGLSQASAQFIDETGGVDTQAGSHPFSMTTVLTYNVGAIAATETACDLVKTAVIPQTGCPLPAANAKDIEVALPAGFVGDPQNVPKCSQQEFKLFGHHCPADTQVGGMWIFLYNGGSTTQYVPVFNVQPPPGRPAELGFTVGGLAHIPMLFHVRTGGDYGLTAQIPTISETATVERAVMSIWGIPAAPAHNAARSSESYGCQSGCEVAVAERPFLTAPSTCGVEPLIAMGTDSWTHPQQSPLAELQQSGMSALVGCEALSLDGPSIAVHPETSQAGSPSGYDVSLKVPQNEEPEGLATPDIKNVEVTLPEGTVISPSAANGLQSCSDALFALHGEGEGECPVDSIVGKVTIHTPLLASPLEGSVYVGQPECAPCTPTQAREGKMVRLFIEAHGSGVLVKLAGRTEIDQATGRLTTVFENNPQLPFDDLELEIEGGQDAPLVNPTTCGPLKAQATLTAWSAITNAAGQVSDPGSLANIESEKPVSTTGCKAAGFSPSFQAGMTKSSRGGSFSGFAVTLTRADGQQTLGSVSTHLPRGVSGMISSVPECSNADANAGVCPATSQIGTATTVVGPGSEPYTIEGGKVFLTGPYGGGPFGLAIVVPDHAGPYTLAGNTGRGYQVVRASIAVDPHTAAVTVTTVPLPTQIDGIPLNIRKVIVNIDREGFMFNPTDCNASAITGTIASSSGTAANVSYPFQATNCASLPFKPQFSALIHAHHTRKDGEYMHVVVKSGAGQANIGRVHVTLPGKLPARLGAALKNACTVAQFDANPAGCPAQAIVGHATAHTPILPVPMEGPAIFVSHGGAGFPDLVLLLQGDGVHITLTGKTFIHEGPHAITTTTFTGIPDVPISRFDLVLPAGTNSALGGDGNMCRKALHMPTVITGQNGAIVKRRTKLKVTGCKPELVIRTHRVHGEKATVFVHVPSAGKLIANGKGLKRSVKRVKKHGGRVGITIHLGRHDRHVLKAHPHERVNATIDLRFKPKHHGKALRAHLKVLIG